MAVHTTHKSGGLNTLSDALVALQNAAATLTDQDKARLVGYLVASLIDGADTTITPAENLIPGQALLGNDGSLVKVESVEVSSAMPGMLAVEVNFGTLYVDTDMEFATLD